MARRLGGWMATKMYRDVILRVKASRQKAKMQGPTQYGGYTARWLGSKVAS